MHTDRCKLRIVNDRISLSQNIVFIHNLFSVCFFPREEARNMWRSQEERWRKEHVDRKTQMEKLFSAIKTQVCMH